MTFEEALKAMREGNKVTRKAFQSLGGDYNSYYYLRPSENSMRGVEIYNSKQELPITMITIETILADDWEIYDDNHAESKEELLKVKAALKKCEEKCERERKAADKYFKKSKEYHHEILQLENKLKERDETIQLYEKVIAKYEKMYALLT